MSYSLSFFSEVVGAVLAHAYSVTIACYEKISLSS